MPSDSIRFEWDDEVLDRLLRGPDGPVARSIERRCLAVVNAASEIVHVDTGRLRASISHVVEEDAQGIVGYVGSNVEYALDHELDYPYLRPALDAARGVS